MGPKETITLISVLILLLLTLTIIILFVVFVKRKNQLLADQERIKTQFKKELTKSKIEIREATLRNISWELHDNIGQLMTLAKINAQLVQQDPSKIKEVISVIGTALTEIRSLSKSINPDSIKKLNLTEAIALELERYNRLDYINANLNIEGNIIQIEDNDEVILFRILQEFFINTIKHSKASKLVVNLKYEDYHIYLHAFDDGVGYTQDIITKGLGLSNMKNRASLINAEFRIDSKIGLGTKINIKYRIKNQSNETAGSHS